MRLRDALGAVSFRRISGPDELDAVFRLRYDAYLAEGAIDPNPQERFSDAYDSLDNCWIFGLHMGGELVSSVRFHVISTAARRGPGLDVFPDLVSPMVESGVTVIDPTRLVASKEASRRHPELPYLTLRVIAMACQYFRAGACLATVRIEHEAFYRRVFGCTPICEPRPYPTLKRPIALMVTDVDSIVDRVARRYPVMVSDEDEREELFGREGSERYVSQTGLQLLNLPAAPLPLRIA
jgi:N-acyl-L-homoserine lactone synthetase